MQNHNAPVVDSLLLRAYYRTLKNIMKSILHFCQCFDFMAATSVTATAACVSARGNFPNATAMLIYNLVLTTGLLISPSGISELDCATTKTDTAQRSIPIGRESLQVSFVLGALAYFQVPPLGGSREEKWRSQ